MYVRFAIDNRDEDSGQLQGLFQAVDDLRHEGRLSRAEEAAAKKIFKWFDKHLPGPKRFSRSRERVGFVTRFAGVGRRTSR